MAAQRDTSKPGPIAHYVGAAIWMAIAVITLTDPDLTVARYISGAGLIAVAVVQAAWGWRLHRRRT